MTDHDAVVLVLGAGFARPAGHPVMAEFRKVVNNLGTDPGSPLTTAERELFKSVLDYRRRIETLYGCLSLDLDNLEELFGVLDIESSLAAEDDFFVKVTRAALVFTLVKTLELTRKRPPEPIHTQIAGAIASNDRQELRKRTKYPAHPLVEYARFAEHLRPHDAIITFNYDTVIEESLLANSIGPSYSFNDFVWPGATATVPVLKLHGSVNFRQTQDGKVEVVDFELLNHVTGSYYEGGVPLIVPPTWNKGSLKHVTQIIWQQAAKVLRRAARIVFIGYSLPETDLGFRYLLANSFLANDRFPEIFVVDPSPATRERYRTLFSEVLKKQHRFHEFDWEFPNVSTGRLFE